MLVFKWYVNYVNLINMKFFTFFKLHLYFRKYDLTYLIWEGSYSSTLHEEMNVHLIYTQDLKARPFVKINFLAHLVSFNLAFRHPGGVRPHFERHVNDLDLNSLTGRKPRTSGFRTDLATSNNAWKIKIVSGILASPFHVC